MILASALEFGWKNPAHIGIFVILLLTAGVTAFYMFRVVFMTFTGSPRDQKRFAHAHESPRVMTIPLVTLAVLSVLSAYPFGWFPKFVVRPALATYATVAGVAEPAAVAAEHSEKPTMHEEAAGEAAAKRAELISTVCSILVAGTGILLSWAFYCRRRFSPDAVRERLRGLHTLLSRKYYLDEIYIAGVVRPVLALAGAFRWFDLTVIDGIVNGSANITRIFSKGIGLFDNYVIDGMVNGVAGAVIAWGRQFRRIQTGRIQNYLLGFVAVALILMVVRLFRGF
jgi:NADH-quinone oxidoreductase subunit L